MEFNHNTPIYLQIIQRIKEQLINGDMLPGDKMPSVREYSKELKVNPTTIQRVYRELEIEGLTFTKRGMGSYVTEEKEKVNMLKETVASDLIKDFIRSMESIGLKQEEIIEKLGSYLKEEETC